MGGGEGDIHWGGGRVMSIGFKNKTEICPRGVFSLPTPDIVSMSLPATDQSARLYFWDAFSKVTI